MITVSVESARFPARVRKLREFFQRQCNRIAVGAYRHEKGKDNFGHRSQDYITRLKKVVRRYEQTGNLELLVDAANYCALEFYNSNHPDQHYAAEESGGRTLLNRDVV